jgi:hypothetical protein
MVKATLEAMTKTLRCVRFDKTESPQTINDGCGWKRADMILAFDELGVDATEVVDHSDYTIYRIRPPSRGRIKVVSLIEGIAAWCDR